jgi:3-hydroxyanthranilate 3,4-dioxygenase
MAISKPFNLTKWIDENRQLLKPPVGNKNLYTDSGDYINGCCGSKCPKDFHYNETEELFYQLEGSITIITQENGERNVLELHAGDMYLHLQSTPFPITFRGFNRLGY